MSSEKDFSLVWINLKLKLQQINILVSNSQRNWKSLMTFLLPIDLHRPLDKVENISLLCF